MNGVLAFGIDKIFFPINTRLVPVPVPFNMVCCPIFVTKQINRLEVSRSNWCLWREGFRKVPESNKQVYTSPLRRSEPHCCNALVRLKARDKTLTHIVTFRLISWFFNLDTQSIYDYMCPAYLWYLIRITGMSFMLLNYRHRTILWSGSLSTVGYRPAERARACKEPLFV